MVIHIREKCQVMIHRIQNGEWDSRNSLPYEMRGEVANGLWDNSVFSYGMEYGYLTAMMDILRETE